MVQRIGDPAFAVVVTVWAAADEPVESLLGFTQHAVVGLSRG